MAGFGATISAVETEGLEEVEEVEEPEIEEQGEVEVEEPGEFEESPEEDEGEGCHLRPPHIRRGHQPPPLRVFNKSKSNSKSRDSGSKPRGKQQQRPRNFSTLHSEDIYENDTLIPQQQNRAYGVAYHYGANDNRQSPSSSGTDANVTVPKKDKIFIVNVKRFIMSSLGVPGIPNVSGSIQTISSLFGVPFYFLLFVWGIVLCTSAAIEMISDDCKVLKSVFALTVCVGGFFILLWLFWALVFWWSKFSNLVSFSLIVILWFVLWFVSVAVTSALTTLIIVHQEHIFNSSSAQEGIDDPVPCNAAKFYRYSSVTALGSVSMLWTVQFTVFLVNVCNCCNAYK